jgi:hypothetical protein
MLVKNPITGKIEVVRTQSETFFFNTRRVRIGILYQRPAPALSRDEEIIQNGLLRHAKRLRVA